MARLNNLGLTPESDPAVAGDGPGPTLFFQKTELEKNSRNRIHFDIKGERRSMEVGRLQRLGAIVRDVHNNFTVMLDPEGNEFCVLD